MNNSNNNRDLPKCTTEELSDNLLAQYNKDKSIKNKVLISNLVKSKEIRVKITNNDGWWGECKDVGLTGVLRSFNGGEFFVSLDSEDYIGEPAAFRKNFEILN